MEDIIWQLVLSLEDVGENIDIALIRALVVWNWTKRAVYSLLCRKDVDYRNRGGF